MDVYGINSVMVMQLTNALEKTFGPLSKPLFFEHQTIDALSDYFIESHAAQLHMLLANSHTEAATQTASEKMPFQHRQKHHRRPRFARSLQSIDKDIAIIGLSGKYPQADTLDSFWENLCNGRDCITEVPKSRWDWRERYSEDRSEAGKHYSKWGGFITDVDKFDPLFFNISPREAELMDPQERLFLEYAWHALEDAGYCRADFHVPSQHAEQGRIGGQVGVYAGVMYGEYQLFGATSSAAERLPLSSHASVANRVSYQLNLHGPSLTIDTMCSSSLSSLHLACQDLRHGRTELAIAGGVNVSIHPNKYQVLTWTSHNQTGMI